jgi:hypothetical protein
MSTFNYHTAYDTYFDALTSLITEPDSFSADLYEDTDWSARYAALPTSLAEAPIATTKTKKTAYLKNLFAAKGSSKWFKVELFDDYVTLWTKSIAGGFIPDCVCRFGPTPSEKWQVSVASPNKPVSRTLFIVPNTHVPPDPSLVPTIVTTGVPATGLPPPLGPAGIPTAGLSTLPAPAVHVHPSASLQAFLLGGGSVSPLPTSADPGITSLPFTSAQVLPPLVLSASPLVAPPGQPIYDLEKFVTGYVAPSTSLVLQANGTFTAPKSARAINSLTTWMAAVHAFGNAMSVSPAPHQFNWPDFIVFIDTISILAKHYAFEAVMTYETEFRRWRRAYGHPWIATNPLLRDAFLLGKNVPAPFANPKAKTSTSTPATVLICHDFSRPSGCSRSRSCRYPHKCKLCNTTFPNTSVSCPCVAGALPPGTSLPPGVTFGQ